MKMRTLLLFLVALSCCELQAQVTTQHTTTYHEHFKPGFVVTKKNDTIIGRMRYDIYGFGYDSQYNLSFDDEGGNTSHYTPDSLRSYTVFLEHKGKWDTLTYVALKTQDDQIRHAFLRICINGALRVYGYTTGTSGPTVGSVRTIERKYVLTASRDLIPVESGNFKKNMREIFAACPVILRDVTDKKYNADNWQQAVIDYNSGICK